jgi:hypothetical protein
MNDPNVVRGGRAKPIVWLGVAGATLLAIACSSGPAEPSFGGSGTPSNQGASSSGASNNGNGGGNGSGNGSSGSQQTSPCTTCGSSGTASSDQSDASSGGPADDDSGTGTTAPSGTGTGDDDAGGTSLSSLFPDAGFGTSTPASGDGGANACSTKICIDPVFDCPLQGCFNGCTNFHCD